MKKKSIFRIRNTRQAITFSIFTGVIAVVSVICLLAAVLVKFDVPSQNVKYMMFVPAAISGLISGGFAGKYVKSKGFLWGCVSGTAVSIIFITVLLVINSFVIDWVAFLIIPVFALSGSIGGIIASNLK